jgi:magnesium-transporting ATPase (P-type)
VDESMLTGESVPVMKVFMFNQLLVGSVIMALLFISLTPAPWKRNLILLETRARYTRSLMSDWMLTMIKTLKTV